MKNFIKWFVRLIACLVFVVIVIIFLMSTEYIPFFYYLNTAIDEVILSGKLEELLIYCDKILTV